MEGASDWSKPLQGKKNKNINPEDKGAYKKTHVRLLLDYIKINAVNRKKNNYGNKDGKKSCILKYRRNPFKKVQYMNAFKIGNFCRKFSIGKVKDGENKDSQQHNASLNQVKGHICCIIAKLCCNEGTQKNYSNHADCKNNINYNHRKKIIPSVAKVFLK